MERLRVLLAAVRDTREVKRTVIRTLVLVDEALDAVLYRPAVVKAFTWAPRWCLCDLAKFSMALDDRWRVGYSDQAGVVPGRPCEACGRRASIHLVGARSGNCGPEQVADEGHGGVLEDRAVHLCGWCHIEGPILTEKTSNGNSSPPLATQSLGAGDGGRAADSAPCRIRTGLGARRRPMSPGVCGRPGTA